MPLNFIKKLGKSDTYKPPSGGIIGGLTGQTNLGKALKPGKEGMMLAALTMIPGLAPGLAGLLGKGGTALHTSGLGDVGKLLGSVLGSAGTAASGVQGLPHMFGGYDPGHGPTGGLAGLIGNIGSWAGANPDLIGGMQKGGLVGGALGGFTPENLIHGMAAPMVLRGEVPGLPGELGGITDLINSLGGQVGDVVGQGIDQLFTAPEAPHYGTPYDGVTPQGAPNQHVVPPTVDMSREQIMELIAQLSADMERRKIQHPAGMQSSSGQGISF